MQYFKLQNEGGSRALIVHITRKDNRKIGHTRYISKIKKYRQLTGN